jgi:hypothetical protein
VLLMLERLCFKRVWSAVFALTGRTIAKLLYVLYAPCRAKEQKAKLYEARLKALAGDEET